MQMYGKCLFTLVLCFLFSARVVAAPTAICDDGTNDGIATSKGVTASVFIDPVRAGMSGTQVFLDRVGDVYPSSAIHIDWNAFTTAGDDGEFDAGRLREYFRDYAEKDPSILVALASDAGLSGQVPSQFTDEFWAQYQAAVRIKTVKEIQAAAAKRDIAMLVHGYRNSYCQARNWYLPLGQRILQVNPDVLLVHIYWDGLAGKRVLRLWKNAQWNMPLVGLGMRRILNEFDVDTPIRIFAHSSGVPMLGSALGDGSAPFVDAKSRKAFNETFQVREPCYAVRVQGLGCEPWDGDSYMVKPLSNVRLGGIAPAASLSTFERYMPSNSIALTRVAMATNPRDSATGKGPIQCTAMGSACMAVRPAETCVALRNTFASRGTEVAVWNFHLTEGTRTPSSFWFWSEHGVEGWSQNSLFDPFLRFMLTDEKPDRKLKAYCGG